MGGWWGKDGGLVSPRRPRVLAGVNVVMVLGPGMGSSNLNLGLGYKCLLGWLVCGWCVVVGVGGGAAWVSLPALPPLERGGRAGQVLGAPAPGLPGTCPGQV
jgi:hypothetical protein